MRPLRSQKTPNVSEKEHFVTIEMLQDSGEQYNWHLLHELVCTGRAKWLGAGDQKTPRVTHGSQRLLMPGEPSKWANLPRCAHVSGDPLSAEKSEDGEMPEEKNQWCALRDASYHHNVGPVLLQYMGTTSTVSLSATCMFAICIAPVIRVLSDESKWYPFS